MAPDNTETNPPTMEETKVEPAPVSDSKSPAVEGETKSPATASVPTTTTPNVPPSTSGDATPIASSTPPDPLKKAMSVGAAISSASDPAPRPLKKSLSARLFKSEKESKKSDSSAASGEGGDASKVVVRAKSFKRIRGFLKRRSQKSELSSTPAPESTEKSSALSRRANLSASVASGTQGEDGSVYNVTLDDRSVASSVTGDASTVGRIQDKYLLRLVLLLMDVNTRRFELLQLEFDSVKAVVEDVLRQVPDSVTEEKLRTQKYSGLVTPDGKEMNRESVLSEFCSGDDVLLAVPDGVDPKEATRLAMPILSDKKVVDMLKGSGLDPTKWLKIPEKPAEPVVEQKPEDIQEVAAPEVSTPEVPDVSTTEEAEKFSYSGAFFFGAGLFLVGLFVASLVHKYISTPIKPGQIVSPGIVLSKCGLDFWSGCEPAYLNVQPGLVSYYEGEKTATWVIHGHSCPEEKVKDKSCVDGLVFNSDRTLWLGGEPIKWLEHYKDVDVNKIESAHLVPWPFSEEPKIKTWDVEESKKGAGRMKNWGRRKHEEGHGAEL